MEIKVRNFRGVALADLIHEKITLIGGRNHNGKSSLCEAVAAVMTGDTQPVPDLPKSQIKSIVREGAKMATAQIKSNGSLAGISWPDANYQAKGDPFKHVGKVSAGMESVMDKKKKERGDVWQMTDEDKKAYGIIE